MLCHVCSVSYVAWSGHPSRHRRSVGVADERRACSDDAVRDGAWVAVGMFGLVGSPLERRRPPLHSSSVVGARASSLALAAHGFLCCIPTRRNSDVPTINVLPASSHLFGGAARGEPRRQGHVPGRNQAMRLGPRTVA